MPIFDEGQTRCIATRDRSLDLFANRFELTRHVVTLINEDPPPERILYLHGLGGNGKSLLLRHLEKRGCLRTDRWEEVRDASDPELLERLAEHGQQVPMARIDFGARPAGENRPQEAFSALFMLKRQLAQHGIATPRFDFAAITYLHKLGFDIAHRVPELFPRGEVNIALDIADAVLALPVLRVGQQLFQMLNARMDKAFTRRRMQRRLSQQDAEDILTLVPEPDLLHELPRLFAKDLNDAAGDHARIVLLFDTHEAFFGEAIGDADSLIHADKLMRDEWLRCLLGHLDLGAGIIAIVAGRTRPPWPSAPVFPIPERYIDHRLVGHLTTADATQYLTLAGITDPAMQAALVNYASTAPDEVHPYFLGLCADVALAAGSRLDPADFSTLVDKERDLARRLLQWTPAEAEYGILAVSACRAFTAETFHHLGQELDFPCDRSAFSKLTAFSFISPLRGGTASGSGAYTMHNILRRSLQHVRPAEVRRSHEVLARHYSGRQEFTAELEAAYHLSHLNAAQGVAAWATLMDRSLATGRFDRCRALASLLSDLRIDRDEDKGRCLYRVARAYLGLGRWSQAEALLDGLPHRSAHAELLRAEVAFCRGDFERADHLAQAALALTEADAREGFLFRLAEIELYRGRFPEGREHATEGMNATTDQAPWLKLLGEIEYFSGNVDRADTLINQALQDVAARSTHLRDQALFAGLLQDAALVAEATGAWQIALDSQNKALDIRKASEDARGIAQSLHGLGKAQCGLGLVREAAQTLAEAGRAARDLGDGLLAAKVTHSEADVRQANGDHVGAWQLTVQALKEFEHHGTPYDVASACLSLARLAQGRERVRYADRGRRAIERGGFGVLAQLFPDQAIPPAVRILNGLAGFCCGDALGVPWEGKPPQDIHLSDTLTTREGWPLGSTSDDTEQLIMLARNLIDTGGSGAVFLTTLAAALPTIRGAGPTTRRAVARFEATGELVADGGATNGAMMRVLPIGWALPATEAERRRELAIRMTKTTHADPKAIATASAVAAMGSWAFEACTAQDLISVAREELDHFNVPITARWEPDPSGVSLDVMDTLGAILHVLHLHNEPVEAMRYAVSLGGTLTPWLQSSEASRAAAKTRRTSPGHHKSLSRQGWTRLPKGCGPCDGRRMRDFWIIGPIAWDLALYVDRIPASGHFVQARESVERPGGTGANVAVALSQVGSRVHMVGYVGADTAGQNMTKTLSAAGVDVDHVQVLPGHTSSVVLLIEPNGERTIIGIHADLLHTITIPVEAVAAGDIVYFAAWHDSFTAAAQAMAAAGALSVPPGTTPAMRYLIGSRNDFSVIPEEATVIVTEGAKGVTVYSSGKSDHYPAIPTDAVDATGAGDAFAAGFLWEIGNARPLAEGVHLGLAWAATNVQVKSSMPKTT